MRRTTTAATLTAGLLLALTACSGGTDDNAKPTPSPTVSIAPSSTPPSGISAPCRAWIETELLDSSDNIDATSGAAVCGDMSEDELNQAIDEVTDDLMAKGAAPADGPEEYSDGDYEVGKDIPAGAYESAGAKPDVIEYCSITTKPTSDATLPQIKTAEANERIIIKLSKADGVVTIKGCEPLTQRK